MHHLLSALAYIHSLGIIHRDIKVISFNNYRDFPQPENLILRSKLNETEICIADFGLADFHNAEGNYIFKRCGTPGYVAPEVL